jgi:hypothetical protein
MPTEQKRSRRWRWHLVPPTITAGLAALALALAPAPASGAAAQGTVTLSLTGQKSGPWFQSEPLSAFSWTPGCPGTATATVPLGAKSATAVRFLDGGENISLLVVTFSPGPIVYTFSSAPGPAADLKSYTVESEAGSSPSVQMTFTTYSYHVVAPGGLTYDQICRV